MSKVSTRTGGRAATMGVIPGKYALSVGDPGQTPPPGFVWRSLTSLARLESGHTPSRRVSDYWGGNIPWIGIRDATANHGATIYETNESTNSLGIANSSARVLPAGTVCLSRTASVGYVVTMGKPMATSQDFVNWVCGPELRSRYLNYIFLLEQESVRRFAHGTTHQTVYYPEAKAFHVCIPPETEQDRILGVLGALDDKIAINGRICSTVLDLADSLFSSVVRSISFGSENFGSVAEVLGGGTPATGEASYWDGEICWATPSDITALDAPYLFATMRSITEDGLRACASRLHAAGSILMTSRATIGAFAVNQVPVAVNQGFIVVVPPKPELRWWLFHEMKSRVDEMIGIANGSTFLELSRKNFKALPVRLPERHVYENFNARVDSLHQRASVASAESTKLAELRDALLPKLMSGEIRVRDAEKIVEDVT
ncbi:restriction endonuclease S subunit [Frankia sp. QA3]|nr:restriction endonuclease S subunit [Frankia sp. QA3]